MKTPGAFGVKPQKKIKFGAMFWLKSITSGGHHNPAHGSNKKRADSRKYGYSIKALRRLFKRAKREKVAMKAAND